MSHTPTRTPSASASASRKVNTPVGPKKPVIDKPLEYIYHFSYSELLENTKTLNDNHIHILGEQAFRSSLSQTQLDSLIKSVFNNQKGEWKKTLPGISKEVMKGWHNGRGYPMENEIRSAIHEYLNTENNKRALVETGSFAYHTRNNEEALAHLNSLIMVIFSEDTFFRNLHIAPKTERDILKEFKNGWLRAHDQRKDAQSRSQRSMSPNSHVFSNQQDLQKAVHHKNEWINGKCRNTNDITLEPFNADDLEDLVIIRMRDSTGEWQKQGVCFDRDMLRQNTEVTAFEEVKKNSPDVDTGRYTSVMASWVPDGSGRALTDSGKNGAPGRRIFVRLPTGTYITLGSYIKIMCSRNREFFMKPLYQGRSIRLGNMYGLAMESQNHGQRGGFVVNKVFTKQEIHNRKRAVETDDEYHTIKRKTWDDILFHRKYEEDGEVQIDIDFDKVKAFMKTVINLTEKKQPKRKASRSA